MHIRSKLAVAALVVAMMSLPGFAQASQDGPPPGLSEQSQGRDGFRPRRPMGEMRSGEPMEQRGRMGMRGQRMGGREFGFGRILRDPNILRQLGISSEQAAKFRQQESDFRKASIRNRAELEIKRMDLNDLLSADHPDRSAIDSKLQDVGAAQLAMEKSAIDFRLTMRGALTPAQRQKLKEIMMQRGRPEPNVVIHGPQAGRRFGRGNPPPSPNQ